jgi:hypothetical protein
MTTYHEKLFDYAVFAVFLVSAILILRGAP